MTAKRKILGGAWLLVTIAAVPSNVQGQAQPDSVKRRNDCRLAAQVVSHGQPANRREWALRLLPDCGSDGGRAVASALASFRNGAGSREHLEQLVMLTSVLHDATVFRTVLSIAVDPSADGVARIQALRVLYFQLSRGAVDPYESFLARRGYIEVPLSDYPYTLGESLPANAAVQVRDAATVVIKDASSDADVRAAARKVYGIACYQLASAC